MSKRQTFSHRFRGYVSSRLRHQLKPDEFGSDSQEWAVEPLTYALIRRRGSTIIQDSASATRGLLESKWGARAQFADPLYSPVITTGYSTPSVLFTDESDKQGAHAWIDPNNAANSAAYQQLGLDFGSTNYSTSASTAVVDKYLALYFDNSTEKLGRWTTAAQRACGTAGSRGWHDVGNYRYFPNGQGTPLRWDKRWNKDTSTSTQNPHLFPWGNIPPIFLPNAQLTAAPANNANNWKDGDAFFLSILFEMDDGSLSRPFEPRAAGTGLLNGAGTATAAVILGTGSASDCHNGHLVVGTVGGTSFYSKITYTSIPRGPDGCKYVWLLRSDVTSLSTVTTRMASSPYELGVIVRLANGTTSYEDANGTTTVASERIRFDSIWAPQCQYATGADGRTVVGGNVRSHPGAIVIGGAINAVSEFTLADTSASLFGSKTLCVKVTSTNLLLRYVATFGGTPTDVTIPLANNTLQNIVDYINESTAIGATAARWGAQLVPGTDGSTLAANLADTSGADYFGDDAVVAVGSRPGNMRVWGGTLPGILYFSQTFQQAIKYDTQSLVMTSASPTVPGGNANSFFANKESNWKSPPSQECGRLMGIAPITGEAGVVCIAFYERDWFVLRNAKGGGTGEDQDYRLLPIGAGLGCVSHRTIAYAFGVAGAMTEHGYVLTDGKPGSAILITEDIWNADTLTGEFTAEMPKAIAAAASGTESLTYFAAKFIGRSLRINYRSDDTLTYCDRGIVYRFSEGSDFAGLATVVRQSDTERPKPYGWSAPIKAQRISVMGSFRNLTGYHSFGTVETSSSGYTTGDGRIDEFNTGTMDNSTPFASDAYLADFAAPLMGAANVEKSSLRYTKPATGLSLTCYLDGPTNQGSRSDSRVLTLASSGSNLYSDVQAEATIAERMDASHIAWRISDDGTGSVDPKVYQLDWSAEIRERLLPT